MTVHTHDKREAIRRKAKAFWDNLSNYDRWELGDALVLGSLDWRDWLHEKPEPGFWNAVDGLRINWEVMRTGGGKKRHGYTKSKTARRGGKRRHSDALQAVIRQHRTGVWYVEGDLAFESTDAYKVNFVGIVFDTAAEARRAVRQAFPGQRINFAVRPRIDSGKRRHASGSLGKKVAEVKALLK